MGPVGHVASMEREAERTAPSDKRITAQGEDTTMDPTPMTQEDGPEMVREAGAERGAATTRMWSGPWTALKWAISSKPATSIFP